MIKGRRAVAEAVKRLLKAGVRLVHFGKLAEMRRIARVEPAIDQRCIVFRRLSRLRAVRRRPVCGKRRETLAERPVFGVIALPVLGAVIRRAPRVLLIGLGLAPAGLGLVFELCRVRTRRIALPCPSPFCLRSAPAPHRCRAPAPGFG